MLALTEKELGHALFYSIKREDFDHIEYLLSLDAPVATSYFISQDRIAYTPNLLAGKVAQTISKLGLAHARSQQVLRILDHFIKGKCDWRCHCVPKNPHYCPLSEVLKWLPLNQNQDLLCEQNLLLLKLLYHGATYKNLVGSKDALWAGISQLQAYIDAKQEQVVQLVKMNRHGKACSKAKDLPHNFDIRSAKCPHDLIIFICAHHVTAGNYRTIRRGQRIIVDVSFRPKDLAKLKDECLNKYKCYSNIVHTKIQLEERLMRLKEELCRLSPEALEAIERDCNIQTHSEEVQEDKQIPKIKAIKPVSRVKKSDKRKRNHKIVYC